MFWLLNDDLNQLANEIPINCFGEKLNEFIYNYLPPLLKNYHAASHKYIPPNTLKLIRILNNNSNISILWIVASTLAHKTEINFLDLTKTDKQNKNILF